MTGLWPVTRKQVKGASPHKDKRHQCLHGCSESQAKVTQGHGWSHIIHCSSGDFLTVSAIAAFLPQHLTPLKSQDNVRLMNSSHAGFIKHLFVCIADSERQRVSGKQQGRRTEEMLFSTCVSQFWAPAVHFYTWNKPLDFSRPHTSFSLMVRGCVSVITEPAAAWFAGEKTAVRLWQVGFHFTGQSPPLLLLLGPQALFGRQGGHVTPR